MKLPASSVVLDTHAWIWFVSNPSLLSPAAKEAISQAQEAASLYVSSISTWEVALLVKKGRLELRMDVKSWISASERLPFLKFIPVDNRIAVGSVLLEIETPSDPADRLIAATALDLGLPLISKDSKLHSIPKLTSIW